MEFPRVKGSSVLAFPRVKLATGVQRSFGSVHSLHKPNLSTFSATIATLYVATIVGLHHQPGQPRPRINLPVTLAGGVTAFHLNVKELTGFIEMTKQIVHIPANPNSVVPFDSWRTWSCVGGSFIAHFRFVFVPFGTFWEQLVHCAKAFPGV